jgi:DNA mismatch repair protein MutL
MTNARIEVLDELVADQIAAGEVIERPASVVKELVENSLDAGAARIQLDIEEGGASRIRVLDNGAGIRADQVKLAFERHATSKIRNLADLDDVASFGFRGEALPSIASVSKIALRTRTKDDIAGVLLSLEGGKVSEQRDVGCPVGADIEIRELFFNTPARLKFLKRETTEASHCSEALVRLAAFRHDVAFSMTSNGRRIRDLPKVDRSEERIASIFPTERLVLAEGAEAGIQVTAILGPSERARPGAGSLYTYVEGRFVRDKTLLKAVTQAFGGTLEAGRYPVGLIGLSLPRGSFDVNVHPQKIEVRFADPQAVYRAVVRVVGEMAAKAVWTLGSGEASKAAEEESGFKYSSEPYRPPGRLVPPPVNAGRLPPPSPPRGEAGRGADAVGKSREWFTNLAYIGQAMGVFLLFEDKDDLVIIDQHAAHERVVYERLRSQLAAGAIASQKLLLVHNIDLGPQDAERIVEFSDDLGRLGLDVVRSGPDRVAIHAVPAELTEASPDRVLADMVLALEEGRRGSRGDAEEAVLMKMACHGSIRGGRSVEKKEIDALLRQLDRVDFAGHCPHGRPVLTKIPWREIFKRVGRG